MIPQPNNAGTPSLPGTPAGSPSGVGSSPVTAPGAGAGNTAAAVAQLKAIFPLLYKITAALSVGSPEWNAVTSAIKSLGSVVGKTSEEDNLVPAALQQMAAARANPIAKASPVGLTAASPAAGEA